MPKAKHPKGLTANSKPHPRSPQSKPWKGAERDAHLKAAHDRERAYRWLRTHGLAPTLRLALNLSADEPVAEGMSASLRHLKKGIPTQKKPEYTAMGLMRIFVGDNLLRPTSPGAETYTLTRAGVKLLSESGHPVRQAPRRVIVSRPGARLEVVTLSVSPLKVLYQLVLTSASSSHKLGQITLGTSGDTARKLSRSLAFHKSQVSAHDYSAMQRDSAELLEAWEMDATALKEDLTQYK